VRRSRQWLLSMVALLLLTASVVSCSGNRTTACTTDALTARSLGDLHSFTTWVQQNGVQGAIGEVGWPGGPDAAKWNTLARKWYAAGDDAQIGVFAWSAAERWAPDYPLAIYRDNGLAASGAAPYVVGSQAQVVESDLTVDGGLRGVSLADGTFGASLDNGTKYSTSNRGTYGTDYVYPSSQFLQFLASQGIRQVRLAFTWERLQPVLSAPLDPTELDRLVAVLHAAPGQECPWFSTCTTTADTPRRHLARGETYCCWDRPDCPPLPSPTSGNDWCWR